MKVNSIQVTYGELRSSGYPSFSNRRYEVTLSAVLQDGDIPEDVRRKLTDTAKGIVKREFGDNDVQGQSFMETPF
ncbi:MAG: hypothetical protein PHF37_10195 [Phycisphaerae bacterium]|nr:hypothetical protein [Phycisphaerae bacterium]